MNNNDLICGDFEDFVSKLYKAIEEAAKQNKGLTCSISPNDCKKWTDEHVTWIEIY